MDFRSRERESAAHEGRGERKIAKQDAKNVTTLLISHPACLAHDMGEGHPERPDRLRAIERALESETFQMLARDVAPRADLAAIARVHPKDYIEAIRAATPKQGLIAVDPDTSMSPGTYEAALRAAGGAVYRGRRSDERQGAQRLRRHAPPRASRRSRDPDGILLLQ